MNNEIQIFNSPQFGEIRTAGTPDNPMFCLADICKALELQTSRVKSRLSERGVTSINTPTKNQHGAIVQQEMIFVNEQNLYKVIMRSDKPQAEPFQDWVCGEVLPSIRKTGGYIATTQDMTDEEIMARAIQIGQKTIERQKERIAALEADNAQQAAMIEQKDETIALQSDEIRKAAPKVQYYNQVMDSTNLLTTKKVALNLGMTPVKLNKLLEAAGIQYKDGGTWYLRSPYMTWNLGRLISHPYTHSDGTQGTHEHWYWNQRGQMFITALSNNEWKPSKAVKAIQGQAAA